MTIILAGATGLIGSHFASTHAAEELHLIGRKPVAGSFTQTIEPIEKWPDAIKAIKPGIAVSTLGTTIRVAGSPAAFRAIDLDLVRAVATAAKDAGCRHFIMVSSVGASARSRNLYLRTKGEAEDAVRALGFDRVDIMRPGLLRGDRSGPSRPGERIAIALSPLTDLLTPHVLDQYRSIKAEDVAKAISVRAGLGGEGTHIHHNAEMLALARALG